MKNAFIILFLFLSGCESKFDPIVTKYNNVVRVFVHDPGEYSILVEDKDTKELTSIRWSKWDTEFHRYKVYADVKRNDNIWVKTTKTWGFDKNTIEIEIHIHNSKEIEGGSWNHNKEGSGHTNSLE